MSTLRIPFFALIALMSALAGTATCATKRGVSLWPEGRMPSVQTNQTYEPYLVWHEPKELKSKGVLIAVPGGGYNMCLDESPEVSDIRDHFLSKGMTVVSVRYRTPRPIGLPKHLTAWQDAQRAVRLVRREAERRGLDPENIGFCGCSAGGHLALLVATSSQTPAYDPVDEIDAEPCHVNWAVPVYPAYGLVPEAETNDVSGCDDLAAPLVSEFAFDAKTPPMCFVHGDADRWSPMVSVRAYHKLRTMGIPAELHVMAQEPHCFMVKARPGTAAATWRDRVWEWLVRMDRVIGK